MAFTVWDHLRMARNRIVVGAVEDDEAVRLVARRLRDEGHEVVFVGGHQTPEQLVATAVAEDAYLIVVDAEDDALAALSGLAATLDGDGPSVERSVDWLV
jgi:methylmalonyl-CoA mutase C-terminal domain/subunit